LEKKGGIVEKGKKKKNLKTGEHGRNMLAVEGPGLGRVWRKTRHKTIAS